jgi:hypothetical protein
MIANDQHLFREEEPIQENDMKKYVLVFPSLVLLALSPLVPQAQAWVGVRLGIALPLYVGPGPYYYGGPYPYYAPTYVAPPPVVYQTAPVVSSAPPTPSTTTSSAYQPAPTTASPNHAVPALTVAPASVDALVRELSNATDTVRRDAALELGRLKAVGAVDALISVLAKDPSPAARDAAARALGLIASPQGLNALIYAAQADNDREVRHSAQFAVEVIRSNLRAN